MDAEKEKEIGAMTKGRIQGQCTIGFNNGDKFTGYFKDGRPNG